MTKIKTILLSLALITCCAIANGKTINLTSHVTLIGALSEVKSMSSSIKTEIKGWKDGDDKTEAKSLYMSLKSKSDKLITMYDVVIADWKKARKENLTLENELKEMEDASNAFVKFYNDKKKSHNPKPGLSITSEVIDLVIGTGLKVWDFIQTNKAKTIEKYTKQTNDQKLDAWDTGSK